MSFLFQPWFWTALFSGMVEVAVFFYAYHVYDQKARIFQSRLAPAIAGKTEPPRVSDVAKWIQYKKRTFRAGNLVYVLVKSWFQN
jgi:hypothetical protein